MGNHKQQGYSIRSRRINRATKGKKMTNQTNDNPFVMKDKNDSLRIWTENSHKL